jgi:hypothetical protein
VTKDKNIFAEWPLEVSVQSVFFHLILFDIFGKYGIKERQRIKNQAYLNCHHTLYLKSIVLY